MTRLRLFLVPVCLVLLLSAVPSRAGKIKLQVSVIEALPASTATYSWTTPGYGSASCSGGAWSVSCVGTAVPPITNSTELVAYQVRLQLPDGRIVLAECGKKINWTDWSTTSLYRNCRRPEEGEADAEFDGDSVKIVQHIRRPSIDGSGGTKTISETYRIRYVLQPPARGDTR
jgi:hypothetical protein